MATLRQYDPKQVLGSFRVEGQEPIDILEGASAGDFVAVATDNGLWTRESDLDGGATRVKNNNRGGTITVTLSASSPANLRLSRVVQRDQERGGTPQVGTVSLVDLNGTTFVSGSGAFIEDMPDPSYGADRGTRTWVFQCAKLDVQVGGHGDGITKDVP